jgi:hypothetical protein
MAKKNTSGKSTRKVLKAQLKESRNKVDGKASNSGKFAAELSPRVRPKKTDK